ncbi:MAG: hypothetical protein RMJ45_01405 [Candidatus Calescibacterium sp.]|nr:hypothetical protein [Candidatus Calescibacterium sp.]
MRSLWFKSRLLFILSIFVFSLSHKLYSQVSQDEELFLAKYRSAEELLQNNQLVDAYIAFSTAYDYALDDSSRSRIKVIMGDILFRWGDTQAAEFVYREAYILDKKNKEALRKLIISKAENLSGDFYEFLKLLPKEEIDSEINYYHGKYILKKEKKPREACDIFDSVRRESDYFPKASYMCGAAMLILGDRDEAMRRFQNAYSFSKEGDKLKEFSQVAIARIYSDVGRFQDALPYYLSITKDSPLFYEAKYETCWILFSLERYNEVSDCIEYFKGVKKSYFTKRLEILEAFLYMNVDLVRAFLIFTAISDYSEMFLSKIIETQNMDPRFWKRDSIKYFSSIEPDIKSWLDFFPEYKMYKDRKEYILSLKKEIDEALVQIERLKSVSVIVADRTIKRYFESLYNIQSKIHNILSSFVMRSAQPDERHLVLSLFSVFEELKNIDFKTREMAAIASLNIHKVASEKEFKNWEKKYNVYNESLKSVMSELDRVVDFQKKNSEYITKMVKILSSKYDGVNPVLSDFISLYGESNNLFIDYSNLWKEIIYTVIKYVEVQEKKLKGARSVLDNFLDYLETFEGSFMRYIFLFLVRNEVLKTYALARYGFIETAWVMKERESDILDKLHILRLEEENNLRDKFSSFSEEIKSISIKEVQGKGDSSFELESSKALNYIDEVDKMMSESLKMMLKVGATTWKEPEKTIQELIEEKEREKRKILEKFEGFGK